MYRAALYGPRLKGIWLFAPIANRALRRHTRPPAESTHPHRTTVLKFATIAPAAALIACATTAPHPPASAPPCAHPAPVDNYFDPALPSVLVSIRAGADLDQVAGRLGERYVVSARKMTSIHLLILSPITEARVQQLRCEPDIESLSYDARTHIG